MFVVVGGGLQIQKREVFATLTCSHVCSGNGPEEAVKAALPGVASAEGAVTPPALPPNHR